MAAAEELLASLDRPSTLSELIERIGQSEQDKISRSIEAEIERINALVEKHQVAARVKGGTSRFRKHQEEILQLTAEEVRAEVAQKLQLLGDHARQNVEELTLGALRQLPPDYRALSVQDAFQMVPGSASGKAGSNKKSGLLVAGQAERQTQPPELKQILQRMEEMDKLKDQLMSAAAQLERLSTDERRSMMDQLMKRSENVVGAYRPSHPAAAVGGSGGA